MFLNISTGTFGPVVLTAQYQTELPLVPVYIGIIVRLICYPSYMHHGPMRHGAWAWSVDVLELNLNLPR
eukprot:SAG31_NODE_6008_length_2216_cov_18.261691_2_plen_69_part_00